MERDRNRGSDERETDRQIEGKIQKQSDVERERQTDRWKETETEGVMRERDTDRQAYRWKDTET